MEKYHLFRGSSEETKHAHTALRYPQITRILTDCFVFKWIQKVTELFDAGAAGTAQPSSAPRLP